MALPSQISNRIYWLDYLRALNIVGTIAFHSFLAYSPFVQGLNSEVLASFPFLDNRVQLPLADLILLVRPLFSMQLMFFISGLFAWRSLAKKGSWRYVRLRALRLLVPLLFVGLLIMPITFFPSELMHHGRDYRIEFAHLWYLWVLFIFDCILVVVFYYARRQIEYKLQGLNNHHVFLILTPCVILSYLPLANVAGESGWQSLGGPFVIPLSRMGLYAVYFAAGVVMGSRALPSSVQCTNWLSPYAPTIPWTKRLCTLSLIPLFAFIICRIDVINIIENVGTITAWIIVNSLYALAGLALVSALILLSKRYLCRQNKVLDNLSKNSYGIYLVHYTFVVWLQYAFYLGDFNPFARPWLVLVLAIVLSWFTADALRRVPLFRGFLVSA